MLITVIGRGHSGTRAMSHTLSASGVYMGAQLNPSGDLIPPDDMYEACRVLARYVEYRGGLEWDFSRLQAMPIDPAFIRHIEAFLGFPPAEIPVRADSVGRWKTADGPVDFDFFPRASLYETGSGDIEEPSSCCASV